MANSNQVNGFFSNLRRLAGMVESETSELKTAVDTPQDKRQQDTSAILVLKDIQTKTKDLQREMRVSYNEIYSNDFGEMLKLCEALMVKQEEQLSTIQNHLQQYGYTPLTLPSADQGAAGDVQKQVSQQAPVSSGEQSEGEHKNNTSEEQRPSTPPNAPSMREVAPSGDRTPQLSDFGLSSTTLQYLADLDKPKFATNGAKMHKPQLYSADSSVCGITPMQHKSDRMDSVPTPFSHSGIHVTPGMLGKHRPIPDMTPDDARMRGPALRGNMDCMDSPVPPVFQTPGMKQISRDKPCFTNRPKLAEEFMAEDTGTPTSPVMMTSSFKHLMIGQHAGPLVAAEETKTFSLKNDDGQSPLPPVFQTPGMKQIRRDAEELQSALPVEPVPISLNPEDMPEPEMPEMTVNFHELDLGSLMQGYRATKPVQHASGLPKPELPKEGSTCPSQPLYGLTQYRAECKEPEPPIFTSTHQQHEPKAPVLLSRNACGLDDDMPPTPEMTMKYNFSVHLGDGQENKPPTVYDNPASTCQSIPPIDEKDYKRQLDYLQRQVSLELLNSSIQKINQILAKKNASGVPEHVSESEIRSQLDLGPKTRSMLLVLVNMKRLKSASGGSMSEPIYRVC